jgi:hypothetical protein
MHGMIDRDLGSRELWRRSLERSRRRRVLAEDARKEIARRKTASVAVSAAVAATPMWPSVTAAADLSKDHVGKLAKKLDNRHVDRILLTEGDTGSSVVQLQRALRIPDDGIFGPQTNWAVETFQKERGLHSTGEVDVRTWLTLFPTDMIVYAPPGAASALGVNHGNSPEWAAVKAPEGDSGADGSAAGTRQASANGKGHDHAVAHAAALFGEEGDSQGPPVGGPQGPVPTGGTPPGIVPVQGPPVQGPPPPPPPSFNFPKSGTVGEMIATMMSAARQIDRRHYAYSWGGGHNASFSGPYDCSGAVSAVLHAAGLLSSPRVSGGFMHWGAPGPGAVTIYANASHVYMSILGHYFGTTHANPGGGAGWFKGGPRPGFAVVHVPFSQLHLRRHRKHHRHVRQRQRQATYRSWGGGATAGGSVEPGSQPQTQQQAAPAPAPAPTSSGSQPARSIAPAPAPVSSGPTVSSGGTSSGVEQAPAPQPVAPAAPTVSSEGSAGTGQTGSQPPVAPTGQTGSGSGSSAGSAPTDSGSTATQQPSSPAPAPAPSAQEAPQAPTSQGAPDQAAGEPTGSGSSQGKDPAAAPSGAGAGSTPGQPAGKEE